MAAPAGGVGGGAGGGLASAVVGVEVGAAPANSLTAALAVAGGGISSGEDYMAAAILAPRRAPQPSRLGAACVTEKRPTARQALRGPDGSMHETVDGMLEEFENASTPLL